VSGVFIAEEIDGVGDRGTVINVETVLEAFLNMPFTSACFTNGAFSQQKVFKLR
jgi:hypothetical protein